MLKNTNARVVKKSSILLFATFVTAGFGGNGYNANAEEQTLFKKTAFASNLSTPTSCAEEDNVNIPISSDNLRYFIIRATHPSYAVGTDNCKENRDNCQEPVPGYPCPLPPSVFKLFDDGVTVVEAVREKEWWPKKNIFMDRESGLLFFYASPVDKKMGIIGDFQLTIYFGKNPKIIELLKKNLNISKKIFSKISPKIRFRDITGIASKLLKKEGLVNAIYSTSDPINFNIGHTIPFSNESMSDLEMKTLGKGSWDKVSEMISKKRVFLNLKEDLRVEPEIAFTIEPRSKPKNNLSIPIVSYHTAALFYKNGKKELLTGFEEIFKLVGMDYML